MSKILFPKLAISSIKKNGKFYFPYIITCIITVSMFYIMSSLTCSKGIAMLPGSAAVQSTLNFGLVIVGLFSAIFLFYTNSFLIKRRKKEIGLYNILGMGKKHIGYIMFFETLFILLISILAGIGFGILLNKLLLLLLFKIINFPVPIGFEVPTQAIINTVCLFVGIFLLILISNLAKIHLSKPIELLHGSNVGEAEPKTKWVLTIGGLICLIAGYVIAITIESPIDALAFFFVAVILVIIGTYCLFTSGSIAILKALKKNKKFYYQTKHFTSVSGMIYRMKQNAVGLANICILSTMVLVMISTTVCMYIGVEDALNLRFPTDISLEEKVVDNNDDREGTVSAVKNTIKNQGLTEKGLGEFEYLSFTALKPGKEFVTDKNNYPSSSNLHVLNIFTAKEYENITGKKVNLNSDEILVYSNKEKLGNEMNIFNKTYTVKNELSEFPEIGDFSGYIANVHYIVVSDENVFNYLYQEQSKAFKDNASPIIYRIQFDLTGTDEQKAACYNKIMENDEIAKNIYNSDCKQESRENFYTMYGGILFLGLFLGILFMMATVLIIYYKQISEGYDDKQRFEIMQKVGMSREEVKKSISSQVLMIFFIPIIVACIHVMGAFNMINKILLLFNLSNVGLFVICIIGTVVVFSIIYAIVYALTAREYYKIVN